MLLIEPSASGINIRGNRIETDEPAVTRYRGENWARLASDLLCGTADPIPDVRIAIVAASHMIGADLTAADSEEWTDAPDHSGQLSYWQRRDDGSWLVIPKSRDAVETAMTWTEPFLKEDEGAIVSDTRYFVFQESGPDVERVVPNILSRNAALGSAVERSFQELALFEFTWTLQFWQFTPMRISWDRLIRLVDPVVSRINHTLL